MADTTMSRPPCSRIHPHAESLPPVWLFSDDLEEFFKLLQSFRGKSLVATDTFQMFISPVEKGNEDSTGNAQGKGTSQKQTSTEQQGKENYTVNPQEAAQQILARSSPSLLYAEIPDRRISLLVSPTNVELRWLCDWLPEEEESYAIPQIRNFLHTKRHPLFFLGQRNWQLQTALLVIALFLWGLNLEGWLNTLTTVFGGSLGVLVLVWTIAGTFLPNHSHLTLWRISRKDFSTYIFLGVVVVLVLFVTALVSAEISCLLCSR